MISLKDIISIEEVISHVSVRGKTRVLPFPHELLEIEGQTYRINYMSLDKDGCYDFMAMKIDGIISDKSSETIFKDT